MSHPGTRPIPKPRSGNTNYYSPKNLSKQKVVSKVKSKGKAKAKMGVKDYVTERPRSSNSLEIDDLDAASRRLLILQTGGTIDKVYPKSQMGYNFEICEPAVERIFQRVRPAFDVEIETICRKDSQDLTTGDRQAIIKAIEESPCKTYQLENLCKNLDHSAIEFYSFVIVYTTFFLFLCSRKEIIITHGTDTIGETAKIIDDSGIGQGKSIVLTGSILPEVFKDSDADFNIGCAIGILQLAPLDTVMVVMSGCAYNVDNFARDEAGRFVGLGLIGEDYAVENDSVFEESSIPPIRPIMLRLESTSGKSSRPSSGIGLVFLEATQAERNPEVPGFEIARIIPFSLAAKDGRLVQGDVIITINGIDIRGYDWDHFSIVEKYMTHHHIRLFDVTKREATEVFLPFGKDIASIGVTIAFDQTGAYVETVAPNAMNEVVEGQRILKVNGIEIAGAQPKKLIRKALSGVHLCVVRESDVWEDQVCVNDMSPEATSTNTFDSFQTLDSNTEDDIEDDKGC
eukprot:UC4_evm3s1546